MEDMPTMEAESAMVLDGLAVGVEYLEAIVVFLLSASHPYASWFASGVALKPSRVADSMRHAYLAAETALAGIEGDVQVRSEHPSMIVESAAHLVMIHRVRTFGVATCFAREAPLGFARMAARQIVATLEQELPYPSPLGPQEETRITTPTGMAARRSATPASPRAAVVPPAAETRSRNEPSNPGIPVVAPALDFTDDPAPDTAPPRSSIGDRVRAVVSHCEAIAQDAHIVRLRLALRTGLGLEAFVYPDELSNEALMLIETAAEDILGLERGKLTEVSSS